MAKTQKMALQRLDDVCRLKIHKNEIRSHSYNFLYVFAFLFDVIKINQYQVKMEREPFCTSEYDSCTTKICFKITIIGKSMMYIKELMQTSPTL